MLWLAGLFFLALRKLAKKLKNKKLWFLPYTFLVLAVAALAYAPLPWGWGSLGGILAALVGWVLGWIGGLLGVSAAMIAGLLLVLAIVFGLVDLIKDQKPDAWAKTMVYAVPVLTLVAAGPLAANVLEFIQTLGGLGPTVVSEIAG